MEDGGAVVSAIDIYGGRHGGGGERLGDGRAEETRVVGGPGSEGKWMHGREGHATNTRGPGGRRDDDGASLSLSKKRPCVRGRLGLRREPEDLSVQTEVTAAVCLHRRDGSTARGADKPVQSKGTVWP